MSGAPESGESPRSFLAEVGRRHVVRVAVAYAATAWLLLQVGSIVLPALEAPRWVLKGLIGVIALCFPLALLLAWALELTPEGLRRTRPGSATAEPRPAYERARPLGSALRTLPLALLVLAAIAVSFLLGGKVATDRAVTIGPLRELTFGRSAQLTSDPGIEVDPALSPDGKVLAYAAGPPGQMNLFIRQVAGGNAIELTGGFPGHHRWPRWSPDGNTLLFVTTVGALSTISEVPAFGGTPRVLVDLDERSGTFSAGVRGVSIGSPAWSPGGERIAYAQGDAIYVQSLSGGAPEKVAEAFEPHSLAWSPDGRFITFVSGNSEYVFGTSTFANAAPSAILSASLADHRIVRVAEPGSMNMSPVWAADGRSLFFVSDRDGTRDIYRVALGEDGAVIAGPERLTQGLDAHTVSLARDGSALAYSAYVRIANIWTLPIPARGPVHASAARPLTTGNHAIEGMAVSHDGRFLAYDSNRGGNWDIWVMPSGGGEARQITTDPADDFAPAWSPSDDRIAFHSFRNGTRDIFTIGTDGRGLEQVTAGPAQDRFQHFSADGRSIVFHSDRAGRQHLFVVTRGADGRWGEPAQLSPEVGSHPRWSPDGRWISFIGLSDRTLRIVPAQGGPSRVLVRAPESEPVPSFAAWSPDSRTLYYKTVEPAGRSSIFAAPLSGGPPALLVRLDDPARASPRPEFAADGRRFYFTVASGESDIWLLEIERARTRRSRR